MNAPASARLTVLAAVLVTPASLLAQDKIIWTDGSTATDVRVVDFVLGQVEYKKGGASATRPSSDVADFEIARVRDEYKRAFSAPLNEKVGTFLDIAKDNARNAFLSQFGYWEAAKVLREAGAWGDAFTVLSELEKELPNSGFIPRLYRWKLDYYLGEGQINDAAKVAQDYAVAAQTRGFPQGSVVEATYFRELTDAVKNDKSPAEMRTAMQRVLQSAANMPEIAARARLRIADSYRTEDNASEARTTYEKILGAASVPADVYAGACVGMGHLELASASKEDARNAVRYFLKAFLLADEAPQYAPEALFYAADALQKWDGPDAGRMRSALRGRLKRSYPDSEFAKMI